MKNLRNGAVLAVLALALTGDLSAQPAPIDPTDPAISAAPVKPGAPRSQLTISEMEQQALELEQQVRADSQHVQHLQALARKEKDVIKLSCVNDKMVKLKAEANLFDSANRDLAVALEDDNRFGAFESASAAAHRVRKTREEADRCAGEADLGSEGQNTFSGPNIVDDPTSGLPFDTAGTLVEPPSYASPYS